MYAQQSIGSALLCFRYTPVRWTQRIAIRRAGHRSLIGWLIRVLLAAARAIDSLPNCVLTVFRYVLSRGRVALRYRAEVSLIALTPRAFANAPMRAERPRDLNVSGSGRVETRPNGSVLIIYHTVCCSGWINPAIWRLWHAHTAQPS